MAHFYNPAQPHIGGKQPLEGGPKLVQPLSGVGGAPPPFSGPGRSAAIAAIIALCQPDPWAYVYPGGASQPYGQRPLPAGFLGIEVDPPPPYTVANIYAVRAAWEPPPPQPTLRNPNGQLFASRVDNPPFRWTGPAGQIVRGAPVFVQLGGATNATTFGVTVNNPINTLESAVALQAIIAAWTPPDPPPVQRGPLSPQLTAVQVNNPPFGLSDLATQAPVYTWLPPAPPPALPGKIAAVPGISVDQPPIPVPEPTIVAISAWVPPDPFPTQKINLNPALAAVTVNNPPLGLYPDFVAGTPVYAWFGQDPLPTLPARLVPITAAFSQPFAAPWLPIVTASWASPDPAPTLPRPLNPAITAVRVDNPPIPTPEPAIVALAAWTPPDPALIQRAPQNPSIAAVPVNNPPFGINGAFVAGLPVSNWVTPDPLPTSPKGLAHISGALVQPVFSQPWLTAAVGAWTPPDPQPTLPRNLNPSITAVRVDSPPFGVYPDFVAQSPAFLWGAPDPAPTVPRGVANISVVVSYNPTSQAWLTTVIGQWVAPDPLPLPPRKLLAGLSVDQPPIPTPEAQILAVASWVPGDPQPTLPRNVGPGIPGRSVDAPPVIGKITPPGSWAIPDPLPTLPVKLLAGISVDNPPGLQRFLPPVAVADPLPTLPRNFAAITQVQGAFTQPWLFNVLNSWAPADPLPTLPGRYVQTPPAVVSQPAPSQAEWFETVIAAWVPLDPAPQRTSGSFLVPYTLIIAEPPLAGSAGLTITGSLVQMSGSVQI